MSTTTDVLPRTMPAIMCHGPKDYRMEERQVPKPGPGEVLIRVRSTGICASDIKCYTGAALFWGDERRKGYCQAPITPGHEFVGEVVGLGEGAAEQYGLEIGDHAIRSFLVGSVSTARWARIGCVPCTTSMASGSGRLARGRNT